VRAALSFVCFLLLACSRINGAEQLPPAPPRYFNDYAGVVSSATAAGLNERLERFEKESSSQIVVAVFDKLPPNSALEDFTVRTFQTWRVGQKGKDNGAVLFVFVKDRQMRIEVGYGLEGKIPDLIAKRIIAEQIAPRFRNGDYDGGLTAGVTALIQAAQGEYKGTGRTNAQKPTLLRNLPWILFVIIILISIFGRSRRGTIYSRRGISPWGGWFIGGGGGGWGGGGGGWSGGSGGGGFSGGGGGSGGGGASGSW
jgi:uncharacterized protein